MVFETLLEPKLAIVRTINVVFYLTSEWDAIKESSRVCSAEEIICKKKWWEKHEGNGESLSPYVVQQKDKAKSNDTTDDDGVTPPSR